MPNRVELCKAADVAEGSVVRFEKDDLQLAVYNVGGEYFVTDDACTHGPGLMSEGYLDGDVIECNFHNGQFNVKTGEIVSPPCMIPLKTYPAKVDGEMVVIEVD